MSRNSGKKRSTAGLILDVILTLCTGGLWLMVPRLFSFPPKMQSPLWEAIV